MRPTLRTVIVSAAGIPASVALVLVSGQLWPVWVAFLGALFALVGLDALLAVGRRRLGVDVDVPPLLYIGDDRDAVTVTLAVPGARTRAVELVCDVSDLLEPVPRRRVPIPPSGRATATIPLVARRRGTARVARVWLRWTGPFGLAARRRVVSVKRDVVVVPNVRAVRAAALEFFARDAAHGLKIDRLLGDGSQFDALREHVPGMDHRAIDWKHSARHRRLVSKEFRAERNHQIILAFDTGHLMSEPIAGIPKLDHAVNAGLLLGYVSMRSGDRVGLCSFDTRVRTFAQPVGGVRSFARLQQLSAELDYRPDETNFTLGLTELGQRLRRRSMIVVLSDFVDTVTAELMIANVHRLTRRHLVVFVTLRDPEIAELVGRAPRALGDVYRSVVAADFVRERELVLEKLRRLGVHALDVPPDELSVQLLGRYLEIKRRELI